MGRCLRYNLTPWELQGEVSWEKTVAVKVEDKRWPHLLG